MNAGRLRVLILGGYGTFGGRLARLLADEPRLTLLIAGRSLDKARAFAGAIEAKATLEPAVMDRSGDAAVVLSALKPDLLIDAAGSFQAAGPDPYHLIRTCIALGICFLDLADATAFVAGISSLDEAAKESGVFVLSGCSSSGNRRRDVRAGTRRRLPVSCRDHQSADRLDRALYRLASSIGRLKRSAIAQTGPAPDVTLQGHQQNDIHADSQDRVHRHHSFQIH